MNAAKERERSVVHRPTVSGAYSIVAIRGDETTADLRRAGLTESFLRSLAAALGDDTVVVEYERFLSDCLAHREPAIAVLSVNNLECRQPARFTTTLVASKSAGSETEIVLRSLSGWPTSSPIRVDKGAAEVRLAVAPQSDTEVLRTMAHETRRALNIQPTIPLLTE